MRLIDCFMEIVTYTSHFLTNSKTQRPPCEDVRKQYQQLLARAEMMRKDRDCSDEEWLDAFFAVCAWIDEGILCSNWPEKERWSQSLLQRVHFNTTNAGEEFFIRLGAVDTDARDVREVYAYCLALGFRGRYFRPEDEDILEEIKRSNLNAIMETGSPELPEKLFPGAYSTTPAERGKKWFRLISPVRLPFIILPVLAFAALFFLYKYMLEKIVVSYFGSGF